MLKYLPEDAQPLVVSYVGVRRAIGISGLLLPVLLGPVGWLIYGIPFQDNMSYYYHTEMRDVFVGTLCAIGIFLFCYRGIDGIENWTANLGCISALGVALFPMDANSDPLMQRSWTGFAHSFFGGVFFLTLSLYSLFHLPRSRPTQPEPHQKQRDFIYRTSGIVILLSLAAMGAYLFLLPPDQTRLWNKYNALFWLEWIALWAFAAAWLTKGRIIIADLAVSWMAFTENHIRRAVENRDLVSKRRDPTC